MTHQLWSYGITTVPSRANDLLPATIESLSRTGFKLPVVFVDGFIEFSTELLDKLPPMVMRTQGVGHLANWMNALFYLYTVFPKATRYALFEDDLICCSNLRSYLDACPYPDKSYWNLLTHDCNFELAKDRGWFLSNQRGKGAVGLVFNRATAARILLSSAFIERPIKGTNGADGMVCEVLKPLGVTEYVHNPSLIQHVGDTSTIGHNWGEVKAFEGETYDPMQLITTGTA